MTEKAKNLNLRYACLVGSFFTLILGPWSGAQFCVAYIESDFLISAILTLLLFITSFSMTVWSSRRSVSRIWFLTGLAWIITGYVIYFRKDFTEKPEAWLYVATVSFYRVGKLEKCDSLQANDKMHLSAQNRIVIVIITFN